jgi:uncharacterized protein (DUF1330 family)
MKAYLIADIEVHNPEMYGRYIQAARPIILAHGGRYLVRGGRTVPFAGDWSPARLLIIEFESMDRLQACFGSPEYLRIAPLRENSTRSRGVMAEGLPES